MLTTADHLLLGFPLRGLLINIDPIESNETLSITTIRYIPKTSTLCYVTIRSLLSHKSVAMYARFEGEITIFYSLWKNG